MHHSITITLHILGFICVCGLAVSAKMYHTPADAVHLSMVAFNNYILMRNTLAHYYIIYSYVRKIIQYGREGEPLDLLTTCQNKERDGNRDCARWLVLRCSGGRCSRGGSKKVAHKRLLIRPTAGEECARPLLKATGSCGQPANQVRRQSARETLGQRLGQTRDQKSPASDLPAKFSPLRFFLPHQTLNIKNPLY
jgi:hypothetical protein